MPGIFGVVAKQADRDPIAIFDHMQQLLHHQPFYRSMSFRQRHLCMGAWSTSTWFDADACLTTRKGITLMIEGMAITLDNQLLGDNTPDIAARILDCYLQQGDDFIKRLGGHFNLALVDTAQNRLQLITDRLGFRHLYWYADDQVFMFGPEVKAFLGWEGFDRSIDDGSIAMMLAKECPYGSRTLFKHAHMLAPGTRLLLEHGKVSVSHYWKPQPEPRERPVNEVLDEALALFERAIEKRIPRSWNGRVLLPSTGGLDSRLLAWLMRNHGAALELYTHGQPDCTDYVIARQIAASLHLESQHRLMPMNPDWAAQYAREATWLNDGQLNMRNATLIGVSKAVGVEPVPFLNGIIGQHMTIGVGSFVKESEVVPITDEEALRAKVLGFSGANNGESLFPLYMKEDRIQDMCAAARDHAWEAFQPLRHIELYGDQKAIFINQTMGARMQGTVDVHKYFFNDMLPFVDDELMHLWLSIPLKQRLGHTLYKEMYRKHLPELARIPWAETGKNLFVPELEAERSLNKRMRNMDFNNRVTRLSLGRFTPRNKDAYAHRELWLRKNSAFNTLVKDLLSDVDRNGCEYFDQSKVDDLFKRFLNGRNYLFKPVLQVASMLLWHEIFISSPPKGAKLYKHADNIAPQ